MDFVKKLTPLEASLLISPDSLTLKNAMRLIVLDLFFKQALSIRSESRTDENGLPVTDHYVSAGELFGTYYPMANRYEKMVLNVLSQQPEASFLMKDFLLVLKGDFRSIRNFRKEYLRTAPALEPYLSSGFFQNLFGMMSRNEEGVSLGKEIKETVDLVDQAIADASATHSEKVYQLLNKMGSHVFLLKNFDPVWLKGLSENFHHPKKEKRKEYDNDGLDIYYDDWSIFDLIYWDMHMDLWEDGTDRYDYFGDWDDAGSDLMGDWGDSDSGCSSDSGGDSGCSGCGGCGGCGS